MVYSTTSSGLTTATINMANQQLVSLFNKREWMHGGGKNWPDKTEEDGKGWGNSEITMFPLVGEAFGNTITIRGRNYELRRHGMSRDLPWETVGKRFVQRYKGAPIGNNKYPRKAVQLPAAFELTKEFAVDSDGLTATFLIKNTGETELPYAIGWHPAFRQQGIQKVVHDDKERSMKELHEITSNEGALLLPETDHVQLVADRHVLTVASDFGHTMIWAPPKQSQICIEPVSALPDSTYQSEFAKKPGNQVLLPKEEISYRSRLTVSRL